MPLRPSKYWMLWGVMLTIIGLMILNAAFIPYTPSANGRDTVTMTAVPESIQYEKKSESSEAPSYNAEEIIDFTKKAACRHNVQAIDTMVEMWYIQKDGHWPRNDLGDIARDKNYFPRGIPRCPVNGSTYRLDPETHRIIGHSHGNIRNPISNENDLEIDGAERLPR